MSLLYINYFSKSLIKNTDMTVLIPNDLEKPFKTLYLLHGDTQNSTSYIRHSLIEEYANKYKIMVVCPTGDKEYWTNMINGLGNYEDHVIETVNYIDNLFPTSKNREDRFIQGLSMGGYGAMKIGLKYNEMFSSIVAESGAVDVKEAFRICLDDLENNPGDDVTYKNVFGDFENDLRQGDDVYFLVKNCPNLPKIFFHVGNKDFIRISSEKFHEFLVENNIEHTFKLYEGDHNWEYWNQHLEEGIRFHLGEKLFKLWDC